MAGEYEKAINIQTAIENIVVRRYLLPAIQRKFTWSHDQVCVLFDSIMRGYPINTFMFWAVTDGTVKESFRFYQFLERYCERFDENNPEFDTKGHEAFQAVIDGQQRLTSLYIGLKGTYAYKLPRLWWPKTKDDAILPPRKLYLDLSRPVDEENNEAMMSFNFKFLTAQQYADSLAGEAAHWFEVGKILDFPAVETNDDVLDVVMDYLQNHDLVTNKYARKTLTRLYFAIRKDASIHYYNETNQSIDHVLDIFIRTNSGGTPLAFSDLLMSIAVANWRKDARQQIDDLVDRVRFGRDMEFYINRDVILKACLMLTDGDIRFKVKNFSRQKVEQIEQEWEEIKSCLLATFELIGSLGLNEASFRAKNAALPIAYYLYRQSTGNANGARLFESINNKARHQADRQVIGKWLHISLLKGVFGGQADAVLTRLRKIIREATADRVFPLARISADYRGTTKDIAFDDEFIDRLLATQKEDPLCFSILALIFSDVDFTRALHVDHLHPAAGFRKENLDTYEFFNGDGELRAFYENPENWNSVVNLHLLDASLNLSKKDQPLEQWLSRPDVSVNRESLLVPPNLSLSLEAFPAYVEARRELMTAKLKALVDRT